MLDSVQEIVWHTYDSCTEVDTENGNFSTVYTAQTGPLDWITNVEVSEYGKDDCQPYSNGMANHCKVNMEQHEMIHSQKIAPKNTKSPKYIVFDTKTEITKQMKFQRDGGEDMLHQCAADVQVWRVSKSAPDENGQCVTIGLLIFYVDVMPLLMDGGKVPKDFLA